MHVSNFMGPSDATTTAHTGTLGSLVALNANPDRVKLIFSNNSPQPFFVKFGPGAARHDFTLRVNANTNVMVQGPGSYAGVVTYSQLSGPTGSLLVTELTAPSYDV